MEYIFGAIGAIGVFFITVGLLGLNDRREMNARIASRLSQLPTPHPR